MHRRAQSECFLSACPPQDDVSLKGEAEVIEATGRLTGGHTTDYSAAVCARANAERTQDTRHWSVPSTRPSEGLELPPHLLGGLEQSIALVADLPSAHRLHDRAGAIKDLVRRMGHAFDVQNRFAELHLRAARRLGELIQSTVRRGGHGSNSQSNSSKRGGSSAPLPPGLSWSTSSRCRRIALLPESQFEEFLAAARTEGILICASALLRYCAAKQKGQEQDPVAPDALQRGHSQVWEAVRALMSVETAIGIRAELVGATTHANSSGAFLTPLKGDIVVNAERAVDSWLTRIYTAYRRGNVTQAVFLFKATTRETWFSLLGTQGWTCCFLGGTGQLASVVAYVGRRYHAFAVVFASLGAVLRGGQVPGGAAEELVPSQLC